MKTKEDIIALNEKQAQFYDTKKRNWITGVWSRFRTKSLGSIRRDLGIQQQIYATHKVWLGDLSHKRVLDLGCYEGNALSMYLAENAKSYLGIDLSQKGIDNLSKRLTKHPNASARAVDFLSDDFTERDFDIVYAYGVIHHFENIDILFERLTEVLVPQGTIISYDPLTTSVPVRFLRSVYRPFQSDADWEWPFTKKVVHKIENYFNVLERRAVLGRSKYVALLNILPYNYNKKLALGRKWHQRDWEGSATSDTDMFRSMHLTMHLQKRA